MCAGYAWRPARSNSAVRELGESFFWFSRVNPEGQPVDGLPLGLFNWLGGISKLVYNSEEAQTEP